MSTKKYQMKNRDDDILSLADIDSCSFSFKMSNIRRIYAFYCWCQIGCWNLPAFFQHGELTIFIYEHFGQLSITVCR